MREQIGTRPVSSERLRTLALALAVAAAVIATPARADDVIRKTPSGTVSGQIMSISPTAVTIDVAGVSAEVPVNQIGSIAFDREPAPLRLVRTAVGNGAYENALTNLDRIKPDEVKRPEVQQDVDYYRAKALAEMALGGSGEVSEAGKQMRAFVQQNPNSFHTFDARQTLGELFAAVGAVDAAQGEFDAVEAAPWPDYKMRAGVAKGRVLAAADKHPEAQAAFEAVLALASDSSDPGVAAQKQAATLGKASAMAQQGQADAAISIVEDVIAAVDKENAELSAWAYVALGNCYRKKPDSQKQAALAYAHVDQLYYQNREAHAEALAKLAAVYNELGQTQRAVDAAQTLKQQYAGSRWAK